MHLNLIRNHHNIILCYSSITVCNRSITLCNPSTTLRSIIKYLDTIHRAEITLGIEEEDKAEEALDVEEVQ